MTEQVAAFLQELPPPTRMRSTTEVPVMRPFVLILLPA